MEETLVLSDAHGHIGTKEELWERQRLGILSVLCAVSPEEAERLLREKEAGGRYLVPACGIHPWYADRYRLEDMERWMASCPVIGEIGMDSVWCDVNLQVQEERFREQLYLARNDRKPVVLHTKGQEKEIASILREYPNRYLVHWYSCDAHLEKYLDMDCYFSVGPDVWWNTAVQQVACKVPADRLLVETDGLDAVRWAREEGLKACIGGSAPEVPPQEQENSWSCISGFGMTGFPPQEAEEGIACSLAGTTKTVARIRGTVAEDLGRKMRNNLTAFIGGLLK